MEHYQYEAQELKLIEKTCIPMAVYQYIDDSIIVIALSDGFRELYGSDTLEEAYQLMRQDIYSNVHPDDVEGLDKAAKDYAHGGDRYNVVYRKKRKGRYVIVHAIGKLVIKENGAHLFIVNYINEGEYNDTNHDIALGFNLLQKKYFQSKDVMNKVSYDGLTGLPDMNYFLELANAYHVKAKKEKRYLCMIFVDLNGMKSFNHKYGFSEGDRLIVAVADLLSKYFGNDKCCRTTADHFAVYDDADEIDDKLKKLVEDLKYVNDGRCLPVRIGVYKEKIMDMTNANATIACDRAKIACDSCGDVYESAICYFDKKMLKKFENRRYVLENIDRAISCKYLKVYYQPIVRTPNGKVCNEEALVRWEDPEKGNIAPLDFIPILEDAKVSYKLDLYVAEQVIAKLKAQAEGGLYVVPNTINLSRTDFYSCDMVEEIRKRVDEVGLDRSRIIVEITESVVMDDVEFMRIQVNRFRELGFEVWMDDFGSGYSSPDILQKIHFDVVKFDKAFVDPIAESEGSRVIITELVRLANGLGSETVAEGVETKEQVDFLKEIGCTRLQGYYFCKPKSLEQIFERNRKGIQIGFENPEESEYYSTLGNINLYDMSFAAADDDGSLNNYFDTMPMFVIEAGDDTIKLSRGNKSFREFMKRHYPNLIGHELIHYSEENHGIGSEFTNAVRQCKKDGKRVIVDAKSRTGDIIHLFIRKIATNPVTKVDAMAIIILGYVDNDAELKHKALLEKLNQERKSYARITAISGDIICIYLVDLDTDYYMEFKGTDFNKSLGIENAGEKFFETSRQNGKKVVCPEDLDMYLLSFTKENILKEINEKGVYKYSHRLIIDGKVKYVLLKAALIDEDDGKKLIVGIIDTDTQVRKDQEYSMKLSAARDIANLDTLTGVKNKRAYVDYEAELDKMIEEGNPPSFAIAVFDLNGLKKINDTLGHQAGDAFIKKGCNRICKSFNHSPVYRVGGDEFVSIVQGEDYKNINRIMEQFEKDNIENSSIGEVVIAAGMSRFKKDRRVSDVFERADAKMYHNKKKLKEYKESAPM